MSNINNEMKATADYAIKSAKEKFGQELDFSEQSIEKLDHLLDSAHQSLSNRVMDKKTNNAILRTANIWGSYLGEFVRSKWDGTWLQKGSERLVSIQGFEFFPIPFVYQKITNHPEYSVKEYLTVVERTITPQEVEKTQLQETPDISQTKDGIQVNRQENAKATNKPLIYIGVFLILIFGFVVINQAIARVEFNSKLDTFLIEAEKLNILIEQGTSLREYKAQLVEVKATYSMMDTWPSSLNSEKQSFDKAIEGWGLFYDVWLKGLESPFVSSTEDFSYTCLFDEVLSKKSATYIGLDNPDDSGWQFLKIDDFLNGIIKKVRFHYSQGKAGVK